MSQSSTFTLPAGPSELCFDKNEFMKATFSVDNFLHEHRNAASLEVIRDDLGSYLKILRLSMIELINHDYGDFVNLSNKLVGLNEYITNIKTSLEAIQENIRDIKMLLENFMDEIMDYLNQKKQLILLKKNIRSLVKVEISITKLIELLDDTQLHDESTQSSILERASLVLIQLQFHAKFCNDYLSAEQKSKVDTLNTKFLKKMRVYFLNILDTNPNEFEHCLRIYASLDKCDIAEKVFQEKCSNYMETHISENALQNSKEGLSEIYTEILNFISLHMKDILLLTHYTDKIKGFNFLINSYWREIEQRIETNLSSIFAPGNPDNFYVNYKCTQNFLSQFETILGSETTVNDFRNHELTKNFQNRWNLPVYFQIRFQEIAGLIESSCYYEKLFRQSDSKSTSTFFDLALNCISKCWAEGIYIEQLFPKFLKLTIQIISRACKFVENSLLDRGNLDTELTIRIYFEINKFLNKIPNILELALCKMPKGIQQHQIHIETCFDDTQQKIKLLLKKIENILIDEISTECDKNIRQVGDIPRLYRKTNREIPSKSSTYILNIIGAINSFIMKFNKSSSKEKVDEILLRIFSKITEKYCNAVQDVLTSVQKTEESLKRLKSLRDKTTNSRNSPDRTMMSDDDKIRLQLQLDVMYWHDEIIEKGFLKENIIKLTDMVRLVEDVTKVKVANS